MKSLRNLSQVFATVSLPVAKASLHIVTRRFLVAAPVVDEDFISQGQSGENLFA